MMNTPKFDRTLTVRMAADYLGLAISTLNKLRCTGGGPSYFKLGRSVRYDPRDLDEWLAAHRIANTSEAAERMLANASGGNSSAGRLSGVKHASV